MTKQELLAHTGSIQQLASIRPVIHQEGLSSGLASYLVHNGELRFEVLAGKCLDIGDFSYKGVNFSFLAKPGLIGRTPYDTRGAEAQRSIMGGLLFTSGAENICAPCTAEGKEYPMHGRLRTTPAEKRSADAFWEGDDYVLQLHGEMREAELFGENMVLRRSIKTVLGEKTIHIRDEFINEAFHSEAMMLLYHFNFGYPLVCPAAEVLLPTEQVTPRDDVSAAHTENWNQMPLPASGEPEYVFSHKLRANEAGDTFAAIVNKELGLGVKLSFNRQHLPYFMQWKSTAAGDYVMGLEPANSSFYGRAFHEKENSVHKLPPLKSECIELTLQVLEGNREIEEVRQSIQTQ